MLKNLVLMLGMMVVTLAYPAAAEAQEGEARDRALFKNLISQREEAHELYLHALEEGVREQMERGEMSWEVQERILRYRDKEDRAESRLVSLSLRHGWEIPQLPETGLMVPPTNLELEKVFQPARALVKARLRQKAASFIARLELPRLTFKGGK